MYFHIDPSLSHQILIFGPLVAKLSKVCQSLTVKYNVLHLGVF